MDRDGDARGWMATDYACGQAKGMARGKEDGVAVPLCNESAFSEHRAEAA